MITCHREKMSTCLAEMQPLFYKQYDEVEPYSQDGLKLDPNYERYQQLEDVGALAAYTARDDGELIGYLVFVVSEHLHHIGTMMAMSDLIYVAPEYRGSPRVAAELIGFAQSDLNVDKMVIGMKIQHEFRKLLGGLGFQPTEELWEKSI